MDNTLPFYWTCSSPEFSQFFFLQLVELWRGLFWWEDLGRPSVLAWELYQVEGQQVEGQQQDQAEDGHHHHLQEAHQEVRQEVRQEEVHQEVHQEVRQEEARQEVRQEEARQEEARQEVRQEEARQEEARQEEVHQEVRHLHLQVLQLVVVEEEEGELFPKGSEGTHIQWFLSLRTHHCGVGRQSPRSSPPTRSSREGLKASDRPRHRWFCHQKIF